MSEPPPAAVRAIPRRATGLRRWLLRRLLLLPVSLLGITFVTFAVLDMAPVDRAAAEIGRRQSEGELASDAARAAALLQLRVRYGLVDPVTSAPRSMVRRYGAWLGSALTFRLAGPGEDQSAFRARLYGAMPVTALLGLSALLLAFAVGVPIGAWSGLRAGGSLDQAVSGALFMVLGVPEFLLVTFLLLAFGPAGLDLLPTVGLRSDGAEALSWPAQAFDLAAHLVLPVATMAVGPSILIARFLRESVARAAATPFVANLAAWGTPPRQLRWRVLRAGMAPLATIVGSLLPMLVGGGIVVEQAFALNGLGRLAWQAVQSQDQGMVMALTLVTSVVTLLALILSDLLHRLSDPRVRLEA